MDMLWVLVGGIALIFAGTVWFLLSRRAKPTGDLLQQPDYIFDIINTTIDDRNHFEIVFDIPDSGMDKRFSGSCIACNNQAFLVDTNISYQVPTWTGQPVRVFFSSGKGTKTSMFECSSRILRVTPYRAGFALELALPARLIANQRRAFVRFAPPSGLVANISLWNEVTSEDRLVPASLPHPVVNLPEVFLKNISAGGAGIGLSLQSPLNGHLKPDDFLLIRFELRDNEGRIVLSLWVGAVIISIKDMSKQQAIALRFTRWVIEGEPDQELSWFPATQEIGIPPLAAWVMRRHLEIHKTTVV